MKPYFVKTKVIPPHRSKETLSRPRLINQMIQYLDKKLIMLIAPAGYGKTTLLSDFITTVEWRSCWFSLDQYDNDLHRFFIHLLASFRFHFPEFGEEIQKTLISLSKQPININFLLSLFINEIYEKINEHFLLVLDDYHFVDSNEEISEFINGLIQNSDENCHIILSSRTLLSISDIPVLIARSQVSGLSQEDLAFQSNEIQELFNEKYQKQIPDTTSFEITFHTEGWITGILLSALLPEKFRTEHLRVAKISRSGLYPYLTQQVFVQLSDEMKLFLLRCSLFDEFHIDVCREIFQDIAEKDFNWENLLQEAIYANLFLETIEDETTENETNWYRFQKLFQTFLQDTYIKEYTFEAQKVMRLLSQRSVENEEFEKAFEYIALTGNLDEKIGFIENHANQLIGFGKYQTLSKWLNDIDPNEIDKHPVLLSAKGTIQTMSGDPQNGLLNIKNAIRLFDPKLHRKHYYEAILRKSIANRLLGDYDSSIKDAEEVIHIARLNDSEKHLLAEAFRAKGTALYHKGHIQEAVDSLTLSFQEFQDQQDNHSMAVLSMEIGLLYKTLGDFDQAESAYISASTYWDSTNNLPWLANIQNNIGELFYLQGHYERAIQILELAETNAQKCGYERIESYANATLGDVYKDIYCYTEAMEKYQKSKIIARRLNDLYILFYVSLNEAVLAYKTGKAIQSRKLFAQAKTYAEKSNSIFEKNLYQLEYSIFEFESGHAKNNIEQFKNTSSYFSSEGLYLEAYKAKLYLAVSLLKSRENEVQFSEDDFLQEFFVKPSYFNITGTCILLIEEIIEKTEKFRKSNEINITFSEFKKEFDKRKNDARRTLRQNEDFVILTPPPINIKAFGIPTVFINQKEITNSDWKSKTARNLLFMLLSFSDGLSKENIGEHFWPGISPDLLKMRFKNIIYRLRHAIGKETILFENGLYQFNFDLDYQYDVQNYVQFLDRSKKTGDISEKIEFSKKAVELYTAPYLFDIDEEWAENERRRFTSINLQTLLNLSDLLLLQNSQDEALHYARIALNQDNCMEEIHRQIMKIHAANGNQVEIIRQYKQCEEILRDELNAEPSQSTITLLNELTGK